MEVYNWCVCGIVVWFKDEVGGFGLWFVMEGLLVELGVELDVFGFK